MQLLELAVQIFHLLNHLWRFQVGVRQTQHDNAPGQLVTEVNAFRQSSTHYTHQNS